MVRIAPLLKEKIPRSRVELEVPNTETLLKPGMFVRVEITFLEKPQAVVIPRSALVKRDGSQGVFVADLKGKKGPFRQDQDRHRRKRPGGGPGAIA